MDTLNKPDEALSEALAESWWAVGLRGILGIAFGLICLFATGVAIISLVLLFSAYMLVDGVFAIVSGIRQARHGQRYGMFILEGIVNIAAGVIAFLWPGLTAFVFVFIIAFWALLSGMFMLFAAFKLTMEHGRWWLALGGVASLIFGVLLLMAPLAGVIVLTWWLGAYAVVFGVLLLVLAFKLHSLKETADAKPAAKPSTTAASSRSPARRSPARTKRA